MYRHSFTRISFRSFKSQLTYHLRKTSTDSSTDDVIFDKVSNKGIIKLNRPKALNAINLSMVKKIYSQLKSWDKDNEIDIILIKGEGDKAFCAGGDVKVIAQSGKGSPLCEEFFREQYKLNHLIGSLSKPYIPLINGIFMGGGVGLSNHSPIRLVTEKALFSMPETRIGFFPDIGSSYFLPKLVGKLGLFLGLTGHRLIGHDIVNAGLATHFVPSEHLNDLEQELLRLETSKTKDYYKRIDDILTKYRNHWGSDYRSVFSLKEYMDRINHCFGEAECVEQIITNLKKDNSNWAKTQIDILGEMSPTSLKVTFELLNRRHNPTLAECLKTEYRLSQRFLASDDFYTGVKALLIYKTRNPVWNPSTLEELTNDKVVSYFTPLSESSEELQF